MGSPRELSQINTIVIHSADVPNGRANTIEDIDAWHRDRGFRRDMSLAPKHQPQLKHIGYHFVIEVDGAVRPGRPIGETGAHAAGHNLNSIGICLVGRDQFSRDQWAALRVLVQSITHPDNQLSGLNIQTICGHRDLSPDLDGDGVIEPSEWIKTCPGYDVSKWLAQGMRPADEWIWQHEPEARA